MIDLPLYPVPSHEWQTRYDDLLRDPYVAQKYNRRDRVLEKTKYIHEFLPELPSLPKGLVVDIGPGPGEFLELCRDFGHQVFGVDAKTGDGGMGQEYLRLSQLMCERQKLTVLYSGLQPCIDREPEYLKPESVAVWNSQGSIEQAFADYMEGEPHHVHKDCRKLTWKMGGDGAMRETTVERFGKLFQMFARTLRPGGIVLIYANGVADQENLDWYEGTIERAAKRAGLELVRYQSRLHKWIKPGAKP